MQEYQTKDLYEAAALVASNEKLSSASRISGVCYFKFQDAGTCKQKVERYHFGELLINAREYQQALSRLKKMIFTAPF